MKKYIPGHFANRLFVLSDSVVSRFVNSVD